MARKEPKPTDKRTIRVPLMYRFETTTGTKHESHEEFDKYAFTGKLSEVIAKLQEKQAEYPGVDILVEHDSYCDDPYGNYETHRWRLYFMREETDEEVAKRVGEDTARQQAIIDKERAEFERLRDKFGG